MGHVTRVAEFGRAFAGATMHDFFNLLTVAILLPVEILTGVLQHAATHLTSMLGFGGVVYKSPIKEFVAWLAAGPVDFVTGTLGLSGWAASGLLLVAALALIVSTLVVITRTMRALLAGRLERALNDVLGRSGLLGMVVGMGITAAVQSSSITPTAQRSLLVCG